MSAITAVPTLAVATTLVHNLSPAVVNKYASIGEKFNIPDYPFVVHSVAIRGKHIWNMQAVNIAFGNNNIGNSCATAIGVCDKNTINARMQIYKNR